MATIIGWGVSNGETVDASATRWATLTRTDLVGGSTPLTVFPGIFPAGGNPFQVTQTSTPGMGVTVKAGVIGVPGNAGSVAPYGLVLDTNTDLPIGTADLTNPRIDLIIVKIYNPGTSAAAGTVEVLAGSPGAVPSRPTLPTGDYHAISIATVAVAANATSILNANISIAQSDTWTTANSDAGWTAAPGGCVRQDGLLGMSSTRRAAWAARLAPGSPWLDMTANVAGYTNGTDLVPTSTRKLYQTTGAADATANSTTPVTVMNSGSVVAIGGTRRIRVTCSGFMGSNAVNNTDWLIGRASLVGTGTASAVAQTWTRAEMRVWGASTSATTYSRIPFTLSHVFDCSAGTLSIRLDLIRVFLNSGNGNVTVSEGCLLVEDIGPA